MALVPSPMANAFYSLYRDYADPRTSARQQAQAYDSYAKQAQAGPTKPLLTGAEVKFLENTLYAAIQSYNGFAVRFATAWANGVFGYWMSPPVKFLGGPMLPATMVMAAPVQPIIIPQLTALYLQLSDTRNAAQQQAAILDAATKLVIVTLVPPPPAGPVPTPLM